MPHPRSNYSKEILITRLKNKQGEDIQRNKRKLHRKKKNLHTRRQSILFFTKKAGVQKTITTKTSIVIRRRNIDIKILSNLPDLIINFKLCFFNGI